MGDKLIDRIDLYEGVKKNFYNDDGVQAIGPGIRVTDPLYEDVIPEDVRNGKRELKIEEYNYAKEQRLKLASEEAVKVFPNHPVEVAEALTDIMYNFGMSRFSKNMPGATKAIKSGNYDKAAEELKWKDPNDHNKGTTLYWKKNHLRALDNYRILKSYGK